MSKRTVNELRKLKKGITKAKDVLDRHAILIGLLFLKAIIDLGYDLLG